jgi:hypothetical protein
MDGLMEMNNVVLQYHTLENPLIYIPSNMVYLIDGGKQPRYQEAFKNIYRFHSIAFSPDGYLLQFARG